MAESMKWPHTLKAGCEAVLDSFSGLVPVKVLSVGEREVSFEVKKTVGAYKKGDRDTSTSMRVIPVGALIRRRYTTTVGPYNVEVTHA